MKDIRKATPTNWYMHKVFGEYASIYKQSFIQRSKKEFPNKNPLEAIAYLLSKNLVEIRKFGTQEHVFFMKYEEPEKQNIKTMKKKDIKEKCKQILNSKQVGERIANSSDEDFLMQVFENHEDWQQKKGVGVDFISVMQGSYNTKCFCINRLDGSNTDISYIQSIKRESDFSKVKKAFREAVRNVIVDFRDKNVNYGVTTCPITGDVLYSYNTHIDHYNLTFNEILEKYLIDKNISELAKKLNVSVDNCLTVYFVDEELNKDFVNFHNQNTNLRAVSSYANLSILRK